MIEAVRLLLKQARLSQGAIARETGLSRSYISYILNGERCAPDWFINHLRKMLIRREVSVTKRELSGMLSRETTAATGDYQ